MYEEVPPEYYEPDEEQPPEPDPERQVDPLDERLVHHCYSDLCTAAEAGVLEMETPRVHVDVSELSGFSLHLGHETRQVRSSVFDAGRQVRGPPYVELDIDWTAEQYPQDLYEDLRANLELEGPVVLWGAMHLWRMETPHHRDLSLDIGTEQLLGSAQLRWFDADPAGWR